jgi:hypothetical protein
MHYQQKLRIAKYLAWEAADALKDRRRPYPILPASWFQFWARQGIELIGLDAFAATFATEARGFGLDLAAVVAAVTEIADLAEGAR